MAQAVEWLPPVAAGVYVAVVVAKSAAIVRAVYWNSDAAGAFVLAELVPGHGHVEIPRFGWWTSLWWLLATRGLPAHEHVWEATAYVFALATALVVGWATWRVAGKWAGATAAAAAVLVGPVALDSLMLVNFHTSTPFTAAVLSAYLVVMVDIRSRLLGVAVGVLAGLNAASDPLLWIAGLLPFAAGAGVLALTTRRRGIAIQGAVVLGVAVACAIATDRVMAARGYHVIPAGVTFAGLGQLGSNFLTLGRSMALLYGANFLSYPAYPSDPLRLVVALVAFAGLGTTLFAAARLVLRRAEPRLRAYACYWAAAALLICTAYWATNLAAGAGFAGGVNYMLTLAPAAGVGAALVAGRSGRGRIAVSLAIALVAATNISSVAQGRAEPHYSASLHGPQFMRLLERERLTHGYASFWDAQSLTWKSGMRLIVAPVQPCGGTSSALCRHPFFTIDSWYRARPGRSFLIVDPAVDVWRRPPPAFGRPVRVFTLDSEAKVYVYPYDVARHIGG